MGLKKLAAKVTDYNDRVESGKANKIKPHHVEKVLTKLAKKCAELESDIAATTSDERRTRLERKLAIARTHMERAQWLLDQVQLEP